MLLKEVTPAAYNPVPLAEFSTHLRLSHGFNDDGVENGILEMYLRNATAVVERRTGQALISRPYTLQVACWDREGHLTLPVGPVTSIDSVRFVSPGSMIDLEPEDWVLLPGTTRQKLTGPDGTSLWPLPRGAVAELTFNAGYGLTWNDVPDDLRQAVLLLASHYYENRFGEIEVEGGLPFGVLSIVEQHRMVRI
ncbi:MAG: head-tail connector protein [Pseudomonadota bacterium]